MNPLKMFLFMALLWLPACAALPTYQPSVVTDVTQAVERTPEPTTTLGPTATATPNYQATAQAAEIARDSAVQTSDAALLQIIAATAAKEALDLQKLQMTQSSSMLTAQADQWTATAAPSAVPGTQTAAALDRSIAKAEITQISDGFTATAEAPTLIVAVAQAQAQAETATAREWANVFMTFCISLGAVIVAGGTVYIVLTRVPAPEIDRQPAVYDAPLSDLLPIPMAPKPGSLTETIRAEIPCTKARLLMLADGIINRNMTLAINQWEGSIVHRSIVDLRKYFIEHGFAFELPGKNGELGILEDGTTFLRTILERGEPPAPHVCRDTSPTE